MSDLLLFATPLGMIPLGMLTIVFYVIWTRDRRSRHYLYWSQAFLLYWIAWAIVPVKGLSLDNPLLVYAELLVNAAFFLSLYAGVRVYQGGRASNSLIVAGTLGIAALLIIAVQIGARAAIIVYDTITFGVTLLMARALWRHALGERIAAVFLIAWACRFLVVSVADLQSTPAERLAIDNVILLAVGVSLLCGALFSGVRSQRKLNELLLMIESLVKRLGQLSDTAELDRIAADTLLNGTGAMGIVLCGLSDQQTRLRVRYARGASERARHQVDGKEIDKLPFVREAIASSRAVVLSTDEAERRRTPLAPLLRQSENLQYSMVLPITHDAHVYGICLLGFDRPPVFGQQELEMLEVVGKSLGLAITNTERRERLEHQALHDGLTNLPNREALHTRFDERRDALGEGFAAALLLIDLDRFKEINDTLGHHTGDELLKHLGSRLRHLLGERDGMVCRLGGDDFAIVIFGLDEAKKAERADALAEQVLAKLQQPVEVGGMSLAVDATIGIALAPRHGTDSRELLRCAEVAMYHGKGAGSTITVYGPELDPHTRERLQLMTDLRHALTGSQLRLHYQPKIEIGSGKVTGVEALIRWQHPSLGFIAPGRFMPMAEVSPLINQITNWVADTAIRQIQAWQARGIDLSIAINVSSRNLVHSGWSDELIDRVRQSGITPELLELEITETVLMQDPAASRATLEKLAQAGIGIAIDDFGTGYSSLSYLQKLPIRALKIDRSFVMHLDEDVQSRRIVETIIGLARGLQLRTVAEGIERAPSLEILRELGCDTAQGYLFAKPMPVEEFEDWLPNWPFIAAGCGLATALPRPTTH